MRVPKLGVKNGRAKLTNNDILLIRQMLISRTPIREIAKKFGVSSTTIFRINHKLTWVHV
jgi:hypothetical protein